MSEQDTLPVDVHPEVALLPWYANGTLPADERERVARHLEHCSDCRRELDDLTQMKQTLGAVYRTQPAPSPRVAQSVLAQVARDAASRSPEAAKPESALAALDAWFRGLFQPQWVPTLAAVLLAAQFGLVFWLTNTPPPSDPVTTRSGGGPILRVRITFHERATSAQIRTVLDSVRGQISEGPDRSGTFLLHIPGTPDMNARVLELLKSYPEVVSKAEPTAP
jgi:anti-sigma-K factor RskA